MRRVEEAMKKWAGIHNGALRGTRDTRYNKHGKQSK
jgi:hypothetical protein